MWMYCFIKGEALMRWVKNGVAFRADMDALEEQANNDPSGYLNMEPEGELYQLLYCGPLAQYERTEPVSLPTSNVSTTI